MASSFALSRQVPTHKSFANESSRARGDFHPRENPRSMPRFAGAISCEHTRPPRGMDKRLFQMNFEAEKCQQQQHRSGSYGEIFPFAVNGHHLVHASVVSVEEIASVGNPLRVGRAKRTLLPLRLPHPSAVLLQLTDQMNTELDLVFNASGSRWNQPPCTL
jgi:hypothetical protein